jgi:hypothetical protein
MPGQSFGKGYVDATKKKLFPLMKPVDIIPNTDFNLQSKPPLFLGLPLS